MFIYKNFEKNFDIFNENYLCLLNYFYKYNCIFINICNFEEINFNFEEINNKNIFFNKNYNYVYINFFLENFININYNILFFLSLFLIFFFYINIFLFINIFYKKI